MPVESEGNKSNNKKKNTRSIISPSIDPLKGLLHHSETLFSLTLSLSRLQVRMFELLHNSQTQILSKVYVPGVNEPACRICPRASSAAQASPPRVGVFDSCYAGRQTGLRRDDGIKKPTIDSY